MKVSKKVSEVAFSSTLALDARAKAMKAEGRDIINMAVGEPDFASPRAAQDDACDAVRSGRTKYTPAGGSPRLRTAIANHLTSTRGVDYGPENVVVCHSAKHALSGVIFSLVNPGDEVLMLSPAWVSYVEQVRFAGGVAVPVPPGPRCRPDLDALRAAVTPRTRGMMINSPANPSGYVLERGEIEQLVALADDHDLWILSDEIYRRLVYEGDPAWSPATLGARERTVIVDGASKAFAMTGYRIGFAAGPPELVAAVTSLHSQLTGCPNAISQEAYAACLEKEPPEVERMAAEFDRRRKFLLAKLEALGLEVPHPRGAFYAFPRVAELLDERGSAGFCEDLLEERELAIVPGSSFGVDDNVRLSYALSMEALEEAVERLGAFLSAHPKVRA